MFDFTVLPIVNGITGWYYETKAKVRKAVRGNWNFSTYFFLEKNEGRFSHWIYHKLTKASIVLLEGISDLFKPCALHIKIYIDLGAAFFVKHSNHSDSESLVPLMNENSRLLAGVEYVIQLTLREPPVGYFIGVILLKSILK